MFILQGLVRRFICFQRSVQPVSDPSASPSNFTLRKKVQKLLDGATLHFSYLLFRTFLKGAVTDFIPFLFLRVHLNPNLCPSFSFVIRAIGILCVTKARCDLNNRETRQFQFLSGTFQLSECHLTPTVSSNLFCVILTHNLSDAMLLLCCYVRWLNQKRFKNQRS